MRALVLVLGLGLAWQASHDSRPGALVQAQPAPVVTITPGTAAPGETVTLQGHGWPAGVSLTARMYEASNVNGPGADMAGALQVDARGSFSVQGTVPRTLFGPGSRASQAVVPGAYTIVVRSGPAPAASGSFTVGAPGQGALLWGEAFVDANGNGQRDSGDSAMTVVVSIAASPLDSPAQQAITDGRGRYALSPVPPGLYRLRAEAEFQSATWVGTATVVATAGQVARADLIMRPRLGAGAPERCAAETGFCLDHDPFWNYVVARGGVDTFGYPVSRTFLFLGCTTQFLQRQLLQQCGSGSVQTMNLLDPGLMPYPQINFSVFPAHDPTVATAAPEPTTPEYGVAVLTHILTVAPETFELLPVQFFSTFVSTVPGADPASEPDLAALINLEIWGFPTSRPAFDPANHNFVYLRFQRGIMHYDHSTGVTRGILLADWFKSLLTGWNLPPDLDAQARAGSSPYLRQYCPGQAGWLCRPTDLPGTDLTFAFEPQ